MKNSIYILIVALIILCSCASQKNYKNQDQYISLILELEGKKQDQLTLYTNYYNSDAHYAWTKELKGYSDDGYKWKFLIPDTVNDLTDGYLIKTRPFDFDKNQDGMLAFSSSASSETRITWQISLKNKETTIKGVFVKERDEIYNGLSHVLLDTIIESPHIFYDIYDIELGKEEDYTDFQLSLAHADFRKLPDEGYDQALQDRIALVQRHPNSRYLLNELSELTANQNASKIKTDMNLIYEAFSTEKRNSYLGLKIKEYISKVTSSVDLVNLKLLNSKTDNVESVIANKSKATLVIFSASWCGPCHKQIPLLKTIHEDLKSTLDIVYISIDSDKNGILSWKNLMNKEEISWKSFLAADARDNLMEQYSIKGIPHSILFYPDSTFKKIDVRIASDKDELYSIFEKQL